MNQADVNDADYSDGSISESEFNEEEQRKFARYFKERRQQKEESFAKQKQAYEDEPYKTKQDEEFNFEEQLEKLQQKFDKKNMDPEAIERQEDYDQYVARMQEMERQFKKIEHIEIER